MSEVFLHRSIGMWVAIAVGVAEDASVTTYTHEVHAPCVDAYTLDFNPFAGYDAQSPDDFLIQGIDVPEEVPSRLDDRVGETCQFALLETSPLNRTKNGAATRGS